MPTPEITVNLWAVLIAGVANMVLGMFWYSPIGFGKAWMKYSGIRMEDIEKHKKDMGIRYAVAFLSGLLMAYVLAHLLFLLPVDSISTGMETVIWIWLGFIATVATGSVLWENKSMKLYFINVLYYLVSLMIMTAIFVSWK